MKEGILVDNEKENSCRQRDDAFVRTTRESLSEDDLNSLVLLCGRGADEQTEQDRRISFLSSGTAFPKIVMVCVHLLAGGHR